MTSLATTDPNYAAVSSLAQTMATTVINSILPQNKISGVTPTMVGAPAFDFTRPGNPAGDRDPATEQSTNFLLTNLEHESCHGDRFGCRRGIQSARFAANAGYVRLRRNALNRCW